MPWKTNCDLSNDNVLVKLDCVNALNTVRRDTILDTVVADNGNIQVCVGISLLRGKVSYRTLHHLVSKKLSARRSSECGRILRHRSANIAQVQVTDEDEVGLYGRPQALRKIHVVASDIDMIVADAARTGLQLNPAKCEIVATNFNEVEKCPIFKDFKRIRKEDLTILGAPILKGPAMR